MIGETCCSGDGIAWAAVGSAACSNDETSTDPNKRDERITRFMGSLSPTRVLKVM